jgi:uncharacterized protein (TIGR02118 family)
MIKVSVLYPAGEGITFDMDYYCNKHMALVADALGDVLKGRAVEGGVANGEGGSPDYIAMGHLTFDTVEAFQESFGPHADKILADIPNFTNSAPKIQISEIKM